MNIRVRTSIYIYTTKTISKRYSDIRIAIFTGYIKAPYAEGGEEIVSHKWESDGEVKRGINDK